MFNFRRQGRKAASFSYHEDCFDILHTGKVFCLPKGGEGRSSAYVVHWFMDYFNLFVSSFLVTEREIDGVE